MLYRKALRSALWLYVLVGLAALVLLSAMAHGRAFFSFDPLIEQSVQASIPVPLGPVLDAVSWVGFPPEVDAVIVVGILAVLILGYRWEAICLAVAAITALVSWFAVAVLVNRPRPSPDLVHVERALGLGSYPSGHVVNITAFFGSLFILSSLAMRPGWYRVIIQSFIAVLIVSIGLARIYSGEHWPSDVLAGYLQGSIVVALTLLLYVRRAVPARLRRHSPEMSVEPWNDSAQKEGVHRRPRGTAAKRASPG